MTDIIISKIKEQLNQLLEEQELLTEELSKANSLAKVAFNFSFEETDRDIWYYHFWVLTNLIEQALCRQEDIIKKHGKLLFQSNL
jgi:hypothetical protein